MWRVDLEITYLQLFIYIFFFGGTFFESTVYTTVIYVFSLCFAQRRRAVDRSKFLAPSAFPSATSSWWTRAASVDPAREHEGEVQIESIWWVTSLLVAMDVEVYLRAKRLDICTMAMDVDGLCKYLLERAKCT